MKRRQLRTWIFISAILFFLLLLLPLKNADNLYNSVIRIHVLANSDSETDQALKISVRDSILAFAREKFARQTSRDEAREEINRYMTEMEQIAENTLAAAGCHLPVKITLGEEYYPTREYETLALPAGSYLSLRVQIGNAQGKNWWCILFPPMCLSSAVEAEDALTEIGMSRENVETVLGQEPNYRIRFKLLELFQETRNSLKELF